MHYAILEDWLDKGRTEELSEEMVRYLEQLATVNSLWNGCNTPQRIIEKLQIAYPELNHRTAKSRTEDAFTYFYLDSNVKKDAYRNLLFEKMLKLVDASILSAQNVDDYNKASLILERAYKMKQLDKPEEDKLPDSIFDKDIKIFELDTSHFEDLPDKVDRNRLAKYIDEMNLLEEETIKIKQDAGLEPKELFTYEIKKKD